MEDILSGTHPFTDGIRCVLLYIIWFLNLIISVVPNLSDLWPLITGSIYQLWPVQPKTCSLADLFLFVEFLELKCVIIHYGGKKAK